MYNGRTMRPPEIKLIVNADDLGRTVRINDGIQKAFREGILSSTSMVANSPAFDHGLNVARSNPALDIGIHLALTEYPPISDSAYLRSLSKKSFGRAFLRLAYATDAQLRSVETEFRRQIEKALLHRIRLTHLDGHNHVHAHPRLAGIVTRLAREYSLCCIRLPRERLAYGRGVGRYLQKAMLAIVCELDVRTFRTALRWPDEFHGFTEGGRLTRETLTAILRRMRPGVHELMCHVGTENDDPPFSIGYRWLDELQAVTSWSREEVQREFGIRIISHQEMEA
ncbi:MAG: Chitooligosaccharide deacetylase [Anaerolineales bacterium]|nr:Chitooligosaccharide deacetylase [Anaerolineales bacterium]